MAIKCANSQLDFFGSENNIVQALEKKKVSSNFPQLSPLLIIEARNLQMNSSLTDNFIHMEHDNRLLNLKHIGHTLIYGNHFTLQTYINEELVSYDGMRNPKIQIDEQSKFPSTSRIKFIVFILQ